MNGSKSYEFAQTCQRAWKAEIAAAHMAITIHERAVRYFSRHEQPDMANIAHERADRARDALRRALTEQAAASRFW